MKNEKGKMKNECRIQNTKYKIQNTKYKVNEKLRVPGKFYKFYKSYKSYISYKSYSGEAGRKKSARGGALFYGGVGWVISRGFSCRW
ncbi:MAG: hypothetical protein HDS33_06415 [Bacteroides sp.]|nr:hypothetical protein [Bacteroides sp.]